MLRLILKVLLVYWIAASIVLIIVDFEPHRQIHHPELTDALDGSLVMNGRLIANEFERGRCDEIQKVVSAPTETLSIVSTDGRLLCGGPLSNAKNLIVSAVSKNRRMTTNHATFQLIAAPVTSANGTNYVTVLKTNYTSALEVYGFLPGYTTIIISFVTTFVVAFLVALPIRKLRRAAQSIATGRLEARVQWGRVLDRVFGGRNRDDIARLVRDFNNMAERLQVLTESQRLLLRDVSHELRSPLTRIRVGLRLVRREPTDLTMRKHLDRIESEVKRLDDLIGQILSLMYLETIQDTRGCMDISLSELVSDLLPAIDYEAGQTGCVITANTKPGCMVKGDGELLRSAVENILRNAIRYVPSTGLIHVETELVEQGSESKSIIRISDNGPGIPEAELASVLRPFYRSKQAMHLQQDGFGIGLAIAQRAADAHGGSINLRNRPEGGLSVEMSFPLTV